MNLNQTFEQLELAAPVVADRLAAVPLLGTGPARGPEYRLLEDALDEDAVEITEVDHAGSVPELKLTNRGKQPVLLLDGDQLIGAKQNRVINITLLIDANTTVVIPVSCVEQGRWRHQSDRFRHSRRTLHASGRRAKMAQVSESLETGSRRADQGAIWDDIACQAVMRSVHSETSAAEDLYAASEHHYRDTADRIRLPAGSRGAIFCVEGRPVGLELFDREETFGKVARKVIDSYAFDAAGTEPTKVPHTAAPTDESIEAFLYRVITAQAKRYKAIGLGEDVRLESLHVVGGALEVDDAVVHLSAFDRRSERRRRF